MARRLGAPIIVSSIEATALKKRGIEIDTALSYQPCQLAPDLEIIPTPGHTKGAFSYLWTSGERRFLFIGDTIVPADGSWKYWVSAPNRPEMRRTTEKFAALRAQVLLLGLVRVALLLSLLWSFRRMLNDDNRIRAA